MDIDPEPNSEPQARPAHRHEPTDHVRLDRWRQTLQEAATGSFDTVRSQAARHRPGTARPPRDEAAPRRGQRHELPDHVRLARWRQTLEAAAADV